MAQGANKLRRGVGAAYHFADKTRSVHLAGAVDQRQPAAPQRRQVAAVKPDQR